MSHILLRSLNPTKTFKSRFYSLSKRLCASSSDDNDAPKKTQRKQIPQVKKSNTEAVSKLNSLLQQILNDEQQTKQKLNLARPKGRNAQTEPAVKEAKVETVDQKIVRAVKDVATTLGGNVNQTESELLNKLMNGTDKVPTNLSDIVRGMKIDRESKAEFSGSRAQQVRKVMDYNNKQQQDDKRPRTNKFQNRNVRQSIEAAAAETIDIFGAEPLGIFTNTEFKETDQTKNETWDRLYKRELKLAITHPPSNYFQEQVLWTEQGKIWKFPINNEQGLEKEQNVYFADHVFLEDHLKPWCPEKGPLRHFMELVCVGLSKNPYLTVEEKRDHIKWFEKYFEEKKKLLKEVGAFPADGKSPKQLESSS